MGRKIGVPFLISQFYALFLGFYRPLSVHGQPGPWTFGGWWTPKRTKPPKNWQKTMPEVLKSMQGHYGTYTNTFVGVLNTFKISIFFNLYINFPSHPPFWPFRSILVPFWIKNGTILAFFSQGPITFDRLFKKKSESTSRTYPRFKLYYDLF